MLLLFRIDTASLGVSRTVVATPRDDCPYAKSNANTFVRARAYRVFLASCVGINLGDIPRGLRHPRDVPSVDPSTLGQKPYTNSPPSSIVTIHLYQTYANILGNTRAFEMAEQIVLGIVLLCGISANVKAACNGQGGNSQEKNCLENCLEIRF